MASNIDPTQPLEGFTTTADTRQNFQHAKDEIEALQAKDASQDTEIAGKEPANANIQAHIASILNPHSVTKAQLGLGSVDNTSDADKPISTAQQAALDGKEPVIAPKNTGFNLPVGTGPGTVAAGNHVHTAAEVGAAPDTHVGDTSHLTTDERAGMTVAAPTGVDPLITQADLNAHTANQTLHLAPNQNDALDGANAPSAGNVFATIADIPVGGSGHVIQDPAGTPMTDRPNLQFTGDVVVTDDAANSRTVVDVTAGAGTGEANTASNLGAGDGIFAQKVSIDLQFKSLVAGVGVVHSSGAQTITVSVQFAGTGVANTVARSDHNHNLEYLGIGAKAADSDLLDGNDSAYFATDAGLSAHVADLADPHQTLPAVSNDGTFLQGHEANPPTWEKAVANHSDKTDYSLLDIVAYEGFFYSCVNAHTAKAWDPADWEATQKPIGFGTQMTYSWSVNTSGDPGAGNVLVNNADVTIASQMHISKTSGEGNDLSQVLSTLQQGDLVGFEENTGDQESVFYTVTGASVDQTTYYAVPVAYLGGAGTPEAGRAGILSYAVSPANKLPPGGTANQVLAKIDGADYNTQWVNQSGGGGDLTDAEFPTYAAFDAWVDNTGVNPTIDFSAGNNQIASNATVGNITLTGVAGTVLHGTLQVNSPDTITSVTTSVGTVKWVGAVPPTWSATGNPDVLSIVIDDNGAIIGVSQDVG